METRRASGAYAHRQNNYSHKLKIKSILLKENTWKTLTELDQLQDGTSWLAWLLCRDGHRVSAKSKSLTRKSWIGAHF